MAGDEELTLNRERDRTTDRSTLGPTGGVPIVEPRAPSPGLPARDPKSDVRSPSEQEPPPLLGSWRALYAVVLGELALCIALFWLFGRVFA